MFCKKDVPKHFTKFIGKHLYQSFFFNKVTGLGQGPGKSKGLQLYLKKRLWHRCFPVNFVKFLRTPILKNTSGGCFYNYPVITSKIIWTQQLTEITTFFFFAIILFLCSFFKVSIFKYFIIRGLLWKRCAEVSFKNK